MSQFQPAYSFLMESEDSRLQYANVPDAPPGAFAISGINSAAFPDDYATIFATPQAQRGPAVWSFYQTKFWNPLLIGGIESQDVANRVLDQSVNGGPRSGPMLLQRAANACGANLACDGILGPNTFAVVNALDPERLLAAYRQARADHYQAIVVAKPEDEKYLQEWIARAQR